jgi:predicted AAA+ superfamily ATPase
MAPSINWKPWHKVVELRPDLRSGDLALHLFAADLHEAIMQNGVRPVYENPAEFFALTFPTHNLRALAGDVCQRLLGGNDKAVRQLQLTYGGGKTHALITLLHLVREPEKLPSLPAVEEFRTAVGRDFPKARVAALCFDKIDVQDGLRNCKKINCYNLGEIT